MGKSSSTVIGYKYLVAYFHGLCAHSIDKFLEFRAANKTAWSGELTASGTININQPNLFGGDKDQGGIVGDVDVLFGEPTQAPNAYLLATFGSQVPAWRGYTTLVFKGGEFGAMNPYPQKPAYKCLATKAGWDNDACWYPEKCEIPLTANTLLPADADGWEYQILPEEQNPGYENLTVPETGWLENGQAPFGEGPDLPSAPNTDWPIHTVLWLRRSVTLSNAGAQTLRITAENGCVVFVNGAIAASANRENADIAYNDQNVVTVPLQAGQSYEIAVKAFDEIPVHANDRTYLTIEISADGLTAINPAHVLYEMRTAADRGQEPTANMADANWRAGADWFASQTFGLCQCEYNADNESVDDFIGRISKLAACSVSRDPVDGLWYLDIANGVYDLASLPILTDDDILEFEDSPSLLDDTINSVAVEYFDPQQWTTVTTRPVTALALISANGLNHQTNQYHELPTADLANRIALRDLASAITPSHGFTITTTRKPYAWRRNTYFRLQAPKRGFADMVCILVEKSDGTLKSGAMKITAVQDIYSLASASFMESEPGVDTRPPQIPLGIVSQAVFEAPYIEVVQNLSRADLAALPADVGYLMAVAKDPAVSRDYSVTVSTDGGSSYADTGALGPWCPTALVVEGDALTDAAPATSFTLSGGTLLDSVVLGSAAVWEGEDADGNATLEWCRVDAIDAVANTLTLGRGCADTPPVVHAANARIWFYDGFAAKDATEYTDGEAIEVELLTNTGTQQLDPSLAMPLPLTFNQRQVRPYPPGSVQISGQWYPSANNGAISVTFNHRDRVGQADQLVDYSAASVGPEAGVTYTLRGYIGGALDATIANQSGSPISWTPSGPGTARIELVAVRNAIESNAFVHEFQEGAPLWTAANLSSPPKLWLNDSSGITDDGTGHCSVWKDISGSGWDATQTDSTKRPLIVAADQDGRRALRFDSLNDAVFSATATEGIFQNVGAGWMMCVFKRNSVDSTPKARPLVYAMIGTGTGPRAALYGGAGVSPYASCAQAAGARLDSDTLAAARNPTALDTSFHMVLGVFDWTNHTLTFYQDGPQVAQNTALGTGGNTSNTPSQSPLKIGNADTDGNPSDADIGEIIVGSGYLLTQSDIDKLFGAAAYRWGLQALLPAAHPYKTDPPTQ